MAGLFPDNSLHSLLGGTPSNALGRLGSIFATPRGGLMELGRLTLVAEPDPAFHVYADKANEYRWKFKAGNHWIMGDGGEGYATEANAVRAIERFRQLVATAPIRYD